MEPLRIPDSRKILRLKLAPGTIRSHPALPGFLEGHEFIGEGSTRFAISHNNPRYISKCAYATNLDPALSLVNASFTGQASNRFEAMTYKYGLGKEIPPFKRLKIFPELHSTEANEFSCIVVKRLTPISELELGADSKLYIAGEKILMVLSRFARSYRAVVIAAMESKLEEVGIIMSDLDSSAIGVDERGNCYIMDWGNGFSYMGLSINPDNYQGPQQSGGAITYHRMDGYDMLYDDDLNRRYIIREKTRYICFYEKKGEKTATVFDTLSGQPDEALTAYAQSIAGAKPSDFIKKMQENNISVVHRLYSRGCYKFNTDDIASRLVSMNAILQARCPDMRLVLGYTSDMEGELTTYSDTDALILCLYIRDRCISSIMLYSTFADSLDISSRTHDAFQGRGYNKLVRAAIIMVCAVIICGSHKFTYIRSVAENPISAYTLIKEFDAEITTEGVELTGDKVQDLAMVKRHYQTPEAYLTIKIDIARNLQHATRLFEETITKLTC